MYSVYAEPLLAINTAMNYLILWLTARFSGVSTSRRRMLGAALLGAVYSLFTLLPQFSFLYSFPGKILLSFLMIAVSFPLFSFRSFLRLLLFFYCVSFALGGTVYGLFFLLTSNPRGLYYTDLLWKWLNRWFWPLLLGAVLLFFLAGRLLPEKWRQQILRTAVKYPVTFFFDGKKVTVTGLLDTGNSLQDPLTGVPVVVVEYRALAGVLPEELKQLWQKGEPNPEQAAALLQGTAWARRLRLIPFTSLGCRSGMLLAFRPDRVVVGGKGSCREGGEVMVALYHRRLSPVGEYQALLPPEIVMAA